jgi:uncharacterized membrane protein YidH (DUF202 family)
MHFLIIWFLNLALLCCVTLASSKSPEGIIEEKGKLIVIVSLLLMVAALEAFGYNTDQKRKHSPCPHHKRKRQLVMDIFCELSPTFVHRSYRMDEDSFYHLHAL